MENDPDPSFECLPGGVTPRDPSEVKAFLVSVGVEPPDYVVGESCPISWAEVPDAKFSV